MVASNSRKSNLLFFGTYDTRKQPRIQVISDGFSQLGMTVETLNVPLDFTTSQTVKAAESPIHGFLFGFRVAKRWGKLAWQRKNLRTQPNVVLVGHMAHFDVLLARVLFPKAKVAIDYLISLHGALVDRRITGKVKLAVAKSLDRTALWVADIVMVDTEEQLLALSEKAQEKAVAVPVGATQEWFGREVADFPRDDKPLSVIFFGLFTPLQGAPVIAKAVRKINSGPKPLLFTFVGRGQDYDECRGILDEVPGVFWIDWLPIDRLLPEVASNHVCLGIFGTTPKAKNVAPTKGFQGMALGRALVTSDSDVQNRIFKSGALYVPAGDPIALANTLEALDADRELLRRQAQEARRVAESDFTPTRVIEPLMRKIIESLG